MSGWSPRSQREELRTRYVVPLISMRRKRKLCATQSLALFSRIALIRVSSTLTKSPSVLPNSTLISPHLLLLCAQANSSILKSTIATVNSKVPSRKAVFPRATLLGQEAKVAERVSGRRLKQRVRKWVVIKMVRRREEADQGRLRKGRRSALRVRSKCKYRSKSPYSIICLTQTYSSIPSYNAPWLVRPALQVQTFILLPPVTKWRCSQITRPRIFTLFLFITTHTARPHIQPRQSTPASHTI